jgi:hypothetical protein
MISILTRKSNLLFCHSKIFLCFFLKMYICVKKSCIFDALNCNVRAFDDMFYGSTELLTEDIFLKHILILY